MSEVKIAPIPDLGQRTDEITIYAGPCSVESAEQFEEVAECLSLIHISEPTRPRLISYAVFCLKKFFFNDTATTEIYTV